MDHLVRLTDTTGIIQHAAYSLPDRDTGYTTDDNARALIVSLGLCELGVSGADSMTDIYMAYLKHSQLSDGRFHNLMDYSRRFVDDAGSEDCLGRCIWAAGRATLSADPAIRWNAEKMLERALTWSRQLDAPRARAQAILGMRDYLRALGRLGDSTQKPHLLKNISFLADSLVALRNGSSHPEWDWFEEVMTYDNALMPAAMFAAYGETGEERHLECAQSTLGFLVDTLWCGRYFRTVGNRGWYGRDTLMAHYDEQPVDAGALVIGFGEAYEVTGEERYYRLAHLAFQWFLGRNSRGERLYDDRTGGCHDGITPQGVNLNMGAESTLSFFLAYLYLSQCAKKRQYVAA